MLERLSAMPGVTSSAFTSELPLTPGGKLDRRALPAPNMSARAVRAYEAPQGEAEEGLAEIWRGLLRIERVGRNDNFFELGGTSLSALQLVIRARSLYSVKLLLPQIFARPTLAELARCIDESLADLKRHEAVAIGRSNAVYDRDVHEEIIL